MRIIKEKDFNGLVAISTEGNITVWDIGMLFDMVDGMKESQIVDLQDTFQPVYSFDISSRLISLGCVWDEKVKSKNLKNSKTKVEPSVNRKIKKSSGIIIDKKITGLQKLRKFRYYFHKEKV